MEFNIEELKLIRSALFSAWDWSPNRAIAEEYFSLGDKIDTFIAETIMQEANKKEAAKATSKSLTFSLSDVLKGVELKET